ncbi:MAG: DNA-binding domain-containing protein [Burkholderiales bacterium]|nr:DNA-binding domain-containing protein [Burkholderiales bacterium]
MIAVGALARFQDDFARALLAQDDAASPALATLTAQPAFAIYRNSVMKSSIDALQANYPAVSRIVGEEWLRAAAAIYARDALPGLPMLLQYGADFADFLARFEPAAELTYLPGVARLDRLWTEAHVAASEDALLPTAAQQLASGNFFRARLQPHAATRWAWFADAPIYTIWSRNRSDDAVDGDIDWRGEGALLTRPQDSVQWRALDHAGCVFLDNCAAGGTLADAAQAALEVEPDADLGRLMANLLEAGAFSRLDMNT